MNKNELTYNVISREQGIESGTLLSASVVVSGKGTEQFTKTWQGTILWIGLSPFRKFHKRKNWFIGITCNTTSKSNRLCETDIRYQTLRSGGPGGQHINKVSTAVRAVHKLTGLVTTASDTRSQMQNKKLATKRLTKLYKLKRSEVLLKEQQMIWNHHNSLRRGDPIRIFKGREFTEVAAKEKQLK